MLSVQTTAAAVIGSYLSQQMYKFSAQSGVHTQIDSDLQNLVTFQGNNIVLEGVTISQLIDDSAKSLQVINVNQYSNLTEKQTTMLKTAID